MQAPDGPGGMDRLLEHSDWARRLATQLVGDAVHADDLVQEAWLAAIERPPRHTENLRAWLGSVVRRLAASEWRGDRRRSERELRGARPEALPPTDQLVHEAQLSKELVEAVVAMADPFKTVLLMRYFRDQKPGEIARELGKPLATVKTQIQRGLEKLREELDGRYGDRRSWCIAMLPMVRGSANAGTLGLGSGLWVAAAALCALGLWHFAEWNGTQPVARLSALSPDSSRAAAAPEQIGHSFDVPRADERLAAPNQVGMEPVLESLDAVESEFAAQATQVLLNGVLLDLDFQPIAGRTIRWNDPGSLRWKDGSKSVITGKNTWVPLEAELRESLRADLGALDSFVEWNFARPDLARALILNEEPQHFETTTDGDGRFQLNLPELSYSIEVLGDDIGVLGRTTTLDPNGTEQRTWFVGQRRSLSGSVVDFRGNPVQRATVSARGVFPERLTGKLAMGFGFTSRSVEVQTDDEGNFQIPGAPLGRLVSLEAELLDARGEHKRVQMPEDPEESPAPILLRLWPSAAEFPAIVLEGRVLMVDGSIAPRATVVFGGTGTVTDAQGQYRLPAATVQGDLMAGRAGTGIALVPAPAEHHEGAGETLRLADIVLPEVSLSIEGHVTDPSGSALPGVQVQIGSGSASFTQRTGGSDRQVYLEQVVSGRRLSTVTTNESGHFRLDGLASRDYELRLQLGAHRITTAPLRAGSMGVALVLR